MTETVQMPPLEQKSYSLQPKQWMVVDVRGTGAGQVLAHIAPDEPIAASRPHVLFHRFSVAEGERVEPGRKVAEVMVDSVVQDIYAFSHGIVSGLVDYTENDIIQPGDVLLHVSTPEDHSSRKTGLHPKPSVAMRILRFGHAHMSR